MNELVILVKFGTIHLAIFQHFLSTVVTHNSSRCCKIPLRPFPSVVGNIDLIFIPVVQFQTRSFHTVCPISKICPVQKITKILPSLQTAAEWDRSRQTEQKTRWTGTRTSTTGLEKESGAATGTERQNMPARETDTEKIAERGKTRPRLGNSKY